MSDKEKERPTEEVEAPETVLDAEIVEETPSETEPPEAELAEEVVVDRAQESPEDSQPEVADAEDEPLPEITPEPVAAPVEKKSGMMPLLLGGVAAGAIGFAAAFAFVGLPTGSNTTEIESNLATLIAAQDAKISQLETDLASAATQAAASTSGTSSAVAQLEAALTSRLSELEQANGDAVASAEALVARVVELEKRPMEAALPSDVVKAYEDEMAGLRQAIAQHRTDIEAIAAEARQMEAAARASENRVHLAGLMSELQAAAINGFGFAPQLGEVEKASGLSAPTSVSEAAAKGVLSMAQLQADFPDAARQALAAARTEDAKQGGQSGLKAFLQNQLGARSVAPKEGDSVDAVLSRAEAAVRAGDLTAALAEMEALPDVAQAPTANWRSAATKRLTVLEDLSAFAAQTQQ